MSVGAITRPGERSSFGGKLAQIDWRLIGLLCVIAGVGALMLYSVGGLSWSPWA